MPLGAPPIKNEANSTSVSSKICLSIIKHGRNINEYMKTYFLLTKYPKLKKVFHCSNNTKIGDYSIEDKEDGRPAE